jgi:4-amino-4-deoxy-L-arabinose transferase-like glycosyltransferase
LRFCALWLLLPLVFFSLASTKRFVYLLPVFPAAALLIGWQLQRLQTERLRLTDWAVRAMALVLLLPGVALTVAGMGLRAPSAWIARRAEDATVLAAMPGFAMPVLVLGLILAVGGLVALLWSFKPRWTAAIGTIAATMLLMAAWSFGVVFPVTDRLIGYPPHVARIRGELRAEETMALYLPSGSNLKMAAFDYYLERPIIVLDTAATAAAELAKPRALLVTDEAGFAELQRADATLAQRVWYRFSLAGPRYVVLRSADRA